MQKTVSVTPCGDYTMESVTAALTKVLSPVGGLDWVTPGMKIVIKTNLIAPMAPEKAATVHPSILCGLTKLLKERGADVVIGDSPGGIYNATYLNYVYSTCGLKEAEGFGAKLNDDFSQKEATYPEAEKARRFTYTGYLDKADAIIDVCKLKTHGMMGLSCGVKNFFGVVPGTMKPEYHYQYPAVEDFAHMLVDLYSYFAPRLVICDAVYGMEGNGPTQGTPRKVGCLMASQSGHALDLLAARLIGFQPDQVPTLQAAISRGLCPETADGLDIKGDWEAFVQKDYHLVPSQARVTFSFGGSTAFGCAVQKSLTRILTPRPQVKKAACIGCGKCGKICPAKAISMESGKPEIDRSKCIHCFCCQEFCPVGAMQVHRSGIARLLGK